MAGGEGGKSGERGDELRAAAWELYGLPPSDFIAARNARASAATKSGDRALAARIRSLVKPTVAVWAVGALVRHRADDIDALLDLGERMREASDPDTGVDRDALRTLGRDRQRMLAHLADEARTLGGELGAAVSPSAALDVEQTLQAALGDPRAAAVVRSGLLTRTLAPAGFGEVDLEGALPDALDAQVLDGLPEHSADRPLRAVPRPAAEGATTGSGPGKSRSTKDGLAKDGLAKDGLAKDGSADAGPTKADRAAADRAARRERERAEAARDAEETRQDAEDAANEVAALDLRADELRDRREHLADELRELKQRIEELTDQLGDTTSEAAFLRRKRAAAQRTADAARRAADRARARLDRLDD
ncbi:hypothetical protein [Herbiconiux solani]|uniref:hypothetical protein n=1 Tax=Herbiconiux solani TaxID=661329 RepID=UPI0008268BE0|nr:hypothetical protein [Herbiconiux solani]